MSGHQKRIYLARPLARFRCPHCSHRKPRPGSCDRCGKRPTTMGRPKAS